MNKLTSSTPDMARFAVNFYFLVAIAFNSASLRSIWGGGVAFTKTDPLPASLALLAAWLLLTLAARAPRLHGALCALVAAALSWSGAWGHVQSRVMYEQTPALHSTHWRYAALINACGALALLARAALGDPRRRIGFGAVACLLAAGAVAKVAWVTAAAPAASDSILRGGQGTRAAAAGVCSDAPFFSTPPPLAPANLPFQRFSQYVAMSDGVELAVDVYLPHGYDASNGQGGDDDDEPPLPTFLHLTRYHRAESRSWLTRFVRLFGHPPNPQGYFPMRSLHYLNAFVADGYAFVSVDVRGTGASFGTRFI